MPFFSVVIPLYNKEKYICKAIDSVLNQSFTDFEVVICDDGSTDDSVEVVKNKYNSDRIRIIKKQNGGPSSARNRGVQEARGEWIVFLDADDLLLPNALESFARLIDSNNNINYFICNYYIASDGNAYLFTNKKHDGVIKNPFFLEALRELTDRPGSSTIRKSLLLEHPFDEKLRRYEDAESQYEIMRSNLVYQSSIPVMISNRDAGCASFYRKNADEDFGSCLHFSGKSFWEQVTLYHLALDFKAGYPTEAEKLYAHVYKRFDLKVVFLLIQIYWRVNTVLNKIFNRIKKYSVDELILCRNHESN